MPAGLPIKFGNVHYYRIAGHYIFGGDLFIARGSLYFFPNVDLAQRAEEVGHVSHELALLLHAVRYLTQRVGFSMSRTEFWEVGLADEKFQSEATTRINKLKEKRRDKAFSETLPLPIHVRTNEISGMKLTPAGRLTFSAQSDTHDFNVGLLRKKQLRNALWEAGLGRV